MRVQQTRVKPDWLTKSKDPAESLCAWIAGAPHELLIDDQGISTKMKGLEVVAPDKDNGIAFFSKDFDTLSRGFAAVAKKAGGKREYYLKGRDGLDLSALLVRWDRGHSRHSNQLAAGLFTVGNNLSVATRMAIFKLLPHKSLMGGDIQSLKKNVESAGRDGKMVQRGVALFICPSVVMPNQLAWGRTYRQIGDTLTMGMMVTIVNQLADK